VLVAQGHLAEALRSFRDALALRERLANADPNNLERLRDFALGHDKIALVLQRSGHVTEALAELRKGRDILARLVAMVPAHAGWKRDLALIEARIAQFEQLAQ
jgi:hypothetical protein